MKSAGGDDTTESEVSRSKSQLRSKHEPVGRVSPRKARCCARVAQAAVDTGLVWSAVCSCDSERTPSWKVGTRARP